MTPCTCDKWRDTALSDDDASIDGWSYCPFCGNSLSGSEKPREEAEWRVMGPEERPDGLQGDEFLDQIGKWVRSNGRYHITVSQINQRNKFVRKYRTKRPLPTQPEE